MGGYERDPAPWSLDGIPADFNGKLLEEDWPRFEQLMENAILRVPSLEDMEVVRLINGPEAFTPDGEFILGPSDVRGFWVGGRLLRARARRRRRDGASSSPSGSSRGRRASTSGRWTRAASARALPQPGVHARAHDRGLLDLLRRQVPRPRAARPAGRCASRRRTRGCSELGAAFGEKSGWERANWFETNAAAGDESLRPRGWAGKLWSPAIGAEHRACREAAALFDETSFAKIEVSGAGAADFLERLCDNRVARDVGAITYTQMLNPRGGIECDFTVTRLADDRFRIVTGTAFGRTTSPGSARTRPTTARSRVEDVTSRYACLGLWGPAAREILAAAHDAEPLDFPYMRARELAVGPVPCLALRVTYVGELGWELYCPIEYGLAPLGRALGGRPRARSRRRRLQGDRLAAAREGLPRLGRRHHARRHAVRGRARLRGQARQGRLPRPRRARGGAASPSGSSPASCSPIRARSRSARSRCASTASSRAA